MIANSPETNGFYDFSTLPSADANELEQFTYDDWAGIRVLFVQGLDGLRHFPHIADSTGWLPHWGNVDVRHPLQNLQDSFSLSYRPTSQPLDILSFHVGRIVDEGLIIKKVQPWEREVIDKAYGRLENTLLKEPDKSWKQKDFKVYYTQIRGVESELLYEQVIGLAGLVVAQNIKKQLYVSKLQSRNEKRGWLAPLVGLCVDPSVNDYDHKVHNVVAVVAQKDGTIASLTGVAPNLYTAYAPFEGLK